MDVISGITVLSDAYMMNGYERCGRCLPCFQENGEQLKALFESNVDQCWEMCQRKALLLAKAAIAKVQMRLHNVAHSTFRTY